MTLPQTFYMSKKYFRDTALLTGGLALLSILLFWWGSGYFFTKDYYYPKAILGSIALFILVAIVFVKDARDYYLRKPYVTFSEEGITMHGKTEKMIGLVSWKEIARFSEMAQPNSKTGRRYYFHTQNPTAILNRIQKSSARKSFAKRLTINGDAVLIIESNRLDCDLTDLKQTIHQHLSSNN